MAVGYKLGRDLDSIVSRSVCSMLVVLYILYMMSSLGGDKARGPREKALPAATHTSQPQKQIQLMEVTGKNQDECMVALHDCNEDVSRAINFLLESTSDMVSGSMFQLVIRICSFSTTTEWPVVEKHFDFFYG
ncbi:hypothetical protein XENOCAPTIV_018953 [Xenoophorus captivus]|uniref:UBA domain-containing protein n=1 Tax=Xenoophorus captivus TaxID=1517983 RepID=A0ABV0QDT6_9TELE